MSRLDLKLNFSLRKFEEIKQWRPMKKKIRFPQLDH